nr:M48 family metallopeptidase [Novosphingobium piscinae]
MFDGRSAERHAVRLHLAGATLVLEYADGAEERVALSALAREAAGPWGERLVRPAHAGWRLDLPEGLPAALATQLPPPPRYGRWIDRIGLLRAVLACTAVSVGLVVAALTTPQWLGPLVPLAVERRIGAALVGDLSAATCHTPAGDAALARLIQAVDLPGQPPVEAQVIKFDMVNAAALPGNRIVLFSGLFDELRSPDAVAGVVAHELGHVRKRHVMQALLREAGLSVVLAGTSGAVPGQIAQITGLRYSRGAEDEADAFARERLAVAAVSPLPTAAFFTKVAKTEPRGAWMAMLASHPASAARAAAYAAAARTGSVYRPALTTAEWQALSRMCDEDKRVRPLLDF